MSRVRADTFNCEVRMQMWQCLAQNAKWSIAARLEQPGVKVMTGTGVTEASADGVELDGMLTNGWRQWPTRTGSTKHETV
jgi:NADH dehydrogenase FAD-containing subunit